MGEGGPGGGGGIYKGIEWRTSQNENVKKVVVYTHPLPPIDRCNILLLQSSYAHKRMLTLRALEYYGAIP